MKKLTIFLILALSLSLISAVPDPQGDHDGDRVINSQDNCYHVYNPFQSDEDNDGIGNCCDSDYFGLPRYCDYMVPPAVCGNGICESTEDEISCPSDCASYAPVCGNSILETGEECDFGSDNGNICNNSLSDCFYCDTSCEFVFLQYQGLNSTTCEDSQIRKSIFSFNFCHPNWECGSWSECLGGLKTRTCLDLNNCEEEFNKPFESTGCEVIMNSQISDESNESTLSPIFLVLIILLAIEIAVLLLLL